MLRKIVNLSINYPWIVIISFILITIFFALQLPNTVIDADLKNEIPADMTSRLNMDRIEEIFGGTEVVILALKSEDVLKEDTLYRVKELTERLESLEEVDQVNSPFTLEDIRGENNQLIIEDSIINIPQNEQEREALRERIKDNDLVYGSIISEDFKAVAVIAILREGIKDKKILDEIDKIIREVSGDEELYLAGLPIVRAEVANNMQKDMKKFIPLGLLIMLIFLYLCFRELSGVLLTLAVMLVSIIVAMGLISLFGWKLQLITIILPVILLAITNDYAIHIIAKYQQDGNLNPAASNKELISGVIGDLGTPIIVAGLTTIIGLLCLLAHIIISAKQLGILAAVGNGLAILGSLFLVPALLVVLPKRDFIKDDNQKKKEGLIAKLLIIISNLVTQRPKKVIITSTIVIIILSFGIPLIKVDTNPINYFDKDSDIVKSDNIINSYFGGSTNISIVAKGDIQNPTIMRKIDDLEKTLKEHESIGEVMAVSKAIRKMNQVLHNDDSLFYKIPDSKNAIAQYFMLYSMSADLDKVVDFDYRYSLINARIPSNSTNQVREVVKYIKDYINKDSDSPFVIIGGFADLLSQLVNSVVQGQTTSLILSLTVIALIVIGIFRSFFAGLLSIIPLGIAMVSLFGLMGYFNIELNMVTALLSSIMIGVGIDYTIHFLWHYREEKRNKNSTEAVRTTLLTVGKAIIFNALSVVFGFIVLMLSNFLPIRFFGFLIVVSISTCLIGALVVLPTICILFKPKFLEVGTVSNYNLEVN
ncbi:patched family protein [Orenia metallireducens]|uniref:Patched family protein n=1 Tax=Orenia metallireducens TaxID=1413210 RepID=A0A1C0AAH7_9FIRM|nr:MMPL family transporter [Orenia metallireducens]OCL27285.1 patched family protein [Orenia metallireducens]